MISNNVLFMILGLSFGIATQHCMANDGIGTIGAGGIEFRKTKAISMDREVLTISVDKIRVEYEFFNNTEKPIQETVLFPMPVYGFDWGCSPEFSGELQDFKVWVNGKQISPSKTIMAKLPNGRDVTARLKELGFTDESIAKYHGVEGLCNDIYVSGHYAKLANVLAKEGLATNFEDGSSIPEWEAAYIYHWTMTFPPKQKVSVAHEYRPFAGGYADGYEFVVDKVSTHSWPSQYDGTIQNGGEEEFCMTRGTLIAAQKAQQRVNKPYIGRVVKYVLTTGANWSGPIKDFTLNLRKRSKDDIVTLCFDGNFVKSDELTLTAHMTNFLPTQDLQVKFYFPKDSTKYGFPYTPGVPQHY